MISKAGRERFLADMDDPRHGTASGYTYGCRCARCRMAGREASRRPRPRREEPEAWDETYRRWQRDRAVELLHKPYRLTHRQISRRVGVATSTVSLWARRYA